MLHHVWCSRYFLQLQELIDIADGVLSRCSERQAEEIQAKQQAVVENWESLRCKMEQRRHQLEQTCKLFHFQTEVSISVPILRIKVIVHEPFHIFQRATWVCRRNKWLISVDINVAMKVNGTDGTLYRKMKCPHFHLICIWLLA